MNLPRRLKIGAHVWPVHRTDTLELDDVWGDANFRHRRIRIDVDAPESVVADTLLHEVIHVIHHECAIGAMWSGGDEEAITKLMTTMLMQVIRDNPKFWELLGGKT